MSQSFINIIFENHCYHPAFVWWTMLYDAKAVELLTFQRAVKLRTFIKGRQSILVFPLFRGSLLPQVWRKKKLYPLPFPTVKRKGGKSWKYNYIICCTVCSPSREVLTRTLFVMSLEQEIGGGEICPLLPNGSCDVIPGTSNLGSWDVSISNNVDFFPRDFDVLQVNTANV